MGIFDDPEKSVSGSTSAPQGSKTVVFGALPETIADFISLSQASLSDPFDTAALTVLALCFYPHDKDLSLRMLNFLKGPAPLSVYEMQFIADRFRDSDYVPRSYFNGAVPSNNYTPSQPYSVTVSDNPYSYKDAGFALLYIRSGGADSPRSVKLRLAKDGKWYLWEQFLLSGIREPESADPWA